MFGVDSYFPIIWYSMATVFGRCLFLLLSVPAAKHLYRTCQQD